MGWRLVDAVFYGSVGVFLVEDLGPAATILVVVWIATLQNIAGAAMEYRLGAAKAREIPRAVLLRGLEGLKPAGCWLKRNGRYIYWGTSILLGSFTGSWLYHYLHR